MIGRRGTTDDSRVDSAGEERRGTRDRGASASDAVARHSDAALGDDRPGGGESGRGGR